MKKKAQKLGFLGGGQLARMMAARCHQMGLNCQSYVAAETDPAAQVADFVKSDDASLKSFCRSLTHLTFESEFANPSDLKALSKIPDLEVFPRADLMLQLQDRLSQKELIHTARLPTSPFLAVKDLSDLQIAIADLGFPLVLKQRRDGYDGYGTILLKSKSAIQKQIARIENFKPGWIAEAWVPFQRELAIGVARNKSNQMSVLPLVQTYQKDSRCLWVKGPVDHPGLARLVRKIKSFMTSTDYVGLLTFELFDIGDKLLVNELAPRVHNSGHYTMEALHIDQFELHIAAGLNRDLPKKIKPVSEFAMYNILGGMAKTPKLATSADSRLHWYGKHEIRPGRKMGHITALASNSDKALLAAKKHRSRIKV